MISFDVARDAVDMLGSGDANVATVFTRLGWRLELVSSINPFSGALAVRLGRPEQPRALVVPGSVAGDASQAVALGYSSEAEFTVHWDDAAVRLFRTVAWQSIPGDTPILQAEPTDTPAIANVLELLRPDAGALRSFAGAATRKSTSHESLSDRLATALAGLRHQSFDASLYTQEDAETRDIELLRTFHQFLYIRFHEDRHGAIGGIRIQQALESPLIGETVQRVLSTYTDRLNSELFDGPSMSVGDLPKEALAEVLSALTEPWKRLRLNFAVTESEIAGRLYQSYLRRRPRREIEGRLIPQAVEIDERSSRGAFYTPPTLAERLTAQTFGPWLEREQPSRFEDVRVVDPACGSGAFLLAAYRLLVAYFERQHGERLTPDERGRLLVTSLFGADVDASAVLLARVQLLEEADLGDHRLPLLDSNFMVGDSLGLDTFQDIGVPSVPWSDLSGRLGGFSLVLTNPPFAGQGVLAKRWTATQRASLREAYPVSMCWGADLAYSFVELAMRLLGDDGRAGFVVPRAVLRGPGGAGIRGLVAPRVEEISDLRGASLFGGALSYIATLVIDNASAGNSVVVHEAREFEAAVEDISEDRNAFRTFEVRRQALDQESWAPLDLRWIDLADEIAVPMQSLSQSGRIVTQGTQTSANAALTLSSSDVAFTGEDTAMVRGYEIDSRRVPLLAKGADIAPWLLRQPANRLLLPFDRPDELGPLTDDVRGLVRELGADPRHPQPGKLDVLLGPKILIRGLAKEPAAAIDTGGSWVTIKGTGGGLALALPSEAKWRLDAAAGLLNSSLYQWLMRGRGVPRAGGWVELPESVVASLPWPLLDDSSWHLIGRASRAARRALHMDESTDRAFAFSKERTIVDRLVFDLLGVGSGLRKAVTAELFRLA